MRSPRIAMQCPSLRSSRAVLARARSHLQDSWGDLPALARQASRDLPGMPKCRSQRFDLWALQTSLRSKHSGVHLSNTMIICLGGVCVPVHLLIPFLLAWAHSRGWLRWVNKEWATVRYWKAKFGWCARMCVYMHDDVDDTLACPDARACNASHSSLSRPSRRRAPEGAGTSPGSEPEDHDGSGVHACCNLKDGTCSFPPDTARSSPTAPPPREKKQY